MKRILLAFAAMFAFTFSISAQPSVSFENPDIVFKFKRCVSVGNIAYLDFIITNIGSKELVPTVLYDGIQVHSKETKIYDDEANMYEAEYGREHTIQKIDIAGQAPDGIKDFDFNLPVGVPLKMRITLAGVDEFATELSLVKVHFLGMNTPKSYGYAFLQARNLPITRQ